MQFDWSIAVLDQKNINLLYLFYWDVYLGCCLTFGNHEKHSTAARDFTLSIPNISQHPTYMGYIILHRKPFGAHKASRKT
jgi:hypothetical protein